MQANWTFSLLFLILVLFEHSGKAQCTLSLINTVDAPCYMQPGGIIEVSMPNNQSYSLMPGSVSNTTGLFSNLSAGVYTVTGTDINACSSSTVVLITQPPPMTISLTALNNPPCFGLLGQIGVTASGATPGYTYSIVPAGGVQSPPGLFSGLPGGTNYTVVATDANNCSMTTTVFLINPLPLTISSLVQTPATCVGSCNGSMTYTVTGGTPPINYTSNPPAGMLLGGLSNLCGGTTYTVTVADANGCTGTTTSTPGIGGLNTPCTVTPVSCGLMICDGAIQPGASGGIPPYTFAITGNQFNNLCPGSYTVSVTDSNNCQGDTVISILAFGLAPAISAGVVTGPGSLSASASNGTPPYQYSLNGSPISPTNSFSYLCSGTYTLSVFDSNPLACQKDTIVVITADTAFAGGSVTPFLVNPTCSLSNNGMISLIVTPANTYQYLWNTGDTTASISNTNAGIFDVRIKNPANQCIEKSILVNSIGTTCGDISGTVFFDSTNNCMQNPGEPGISNTLLIANPGNHMAFTDANGHFEFNGLPYGTYTISHQNNVPSFQTNCGNNVNLTLSAGSPNQAIAFGDTATTQVDYRIFLNSTQCFIIPNSFKQKLIGYYHLTPSLSSQATVYAVFDSISHYLSSSPSHSSISGDTVFWNTNVPYYYANHISVQFAFPFSYTVLNTAPFKLGLSNLQHPDVVPLNNSVNYTLPFCNSYDPNDKSVAPKGEGPNGNILASDLQMTYHINFQNTGNAPAFNIVIEDTLSDKLDLTTFEVIDYSHPYQLEVVNNQVIRWKFYNIMLPDSNSNEPASHGHITYQIRQKTGNQIGDIIRNKAYIYFDYNPPIITNETVNTIYQPAGLNGFPGKVGHVTIYPNPATKQLFIDSDTPFDEVVLYNAQMQPVFTKQQTGLKQMGIPVSSLCPGIYFVRAGKGALKKVVIGR